VSRPRIEDINHGRGRAGRRRAGTSKRSAARDIEPAAATSDHQALETDSAIQRVGRATTHARGIHDNNAISSLLREKGV